MPSWSTAGPRAAIQERLENHLAAANIEGVQPEKVYGTMVDGKVIRPVIDEEGNSVQGGIRANQTGNISLPNITEARRMAQAIRSRRVPRACWRESTTSSTTT